MELLRYKLYKALKIAGDFEVFLTMNFTKADLQKETTYKASRSSGKGGQNVNKVSSKVELLFNLEPSSLFTEEEKLRIISKLQSRLNKDGYLQVICEEERSQYLNKEKAMEKLLTLLTNALHVPKIRKKVKPTRAMIAARLAKKKILSDKKENRKNNFGD